MDNKSRRIYRMAMGVIMVGIALIGVVRSANADNAQSYLNPATIGWISGLNGGYEYPSASLGIVRAGTYAGLIYQGILAGSCIYNTQIVVNGVAHQVTIQYSADNGLTWNNPGMCAGTGYGYVLIRFTFDVPITFTGSDIVLLNNDWGDTSRGAILNHADSPKQQFRSDGVTLIQEGTDIDDFAVVLQAVATSPYGDPLQVQFEMRSITEPFNGEPTATSGFVVWGSTVTATVPVAENTEYRWRTRTINEQGEASDWEEFGTPGNVDFKARMRYWIPIGDTNAIGQIRANTTQSGAIFLQSIIGDGSSLTRLQLKGDFSNTDIVNQYINNGVAIRILDPSNPGATFYITRWTGAFDFSDPSVLKWTRTDGVTQILQKGHEYKMGINFNGYIGILDGTIGNEYIHGSLSWEPTWYQPYGGTCDSEWAPYYGTHSCRYTGAMTDLTFLINGPEGYTIGQNSVPAITALQQFSSDGTTPIVEHATTTSSTAVFKAVVDPASSESATVQIELRRSEEPFTGSDDGGILQSNLVAPGTQVTLARTTLADGPYHWRARTLDAQGNASDWQEFGTAGNTDFIVDLPLSYKAANLAKQLVNQNYLWGGKGWDVNNRLFVDSDAVKTGYNYWTDTGKVAFDDGLDCSGLVAWAYNHSYDPNKFFNQNYIGEPNANKQYRYNMQATTTSDVGLQPGDLLFFDNAPKDGRIDHVAMYVGEQGGYDVVEAGSKVLGIIPTTLQNAKSRSGFVAFGRPKNATIAMSIVKHSPIHFSVTDPDGNTISDSTGIATDEEYIRESDDLTYATMGIDANGYPEDVIYSPILKQGTYKVNVTPFASSTLNQTYSLDFTAGSTTIVLAQNIPLSQIPSEGYGVEVSASGTISTFIPVLIDIKPNSLPNSINLGSNGVVPIAIFGSETFDVHQIDLVTIKLANASVKLKGNGQPMASYFDVNGDGYTDIIIQVSAQALQLTPSDIMAELEGKLINGTLIKGPDSVRIIP